MEVCTKRLAEEEVQYQHKELYIKSTNMNQGTHHIKTRISIHSQNTFFLSGEDYPPFITLETRHEAFHADIHIREPALSQTTK